MGIINNMLMRLVEKMKGKKGKVEFLEKTGHPEGFKDHELYDKKVWHKLLSSAVKITGLKSEKLQKRFAKFVLPILVKKFRFYFDISPDALSFMARVPDIHQVWPGKGENREDKFKKVTTSENEVTFEYVSPNKLCVFIKALTIEVFKYYNEEPIIKKHSCMLDGDECCKFSIKSKGKIKN